MSSSEASVPESVGTRSRPIPAQDATFTVAAFAAGAGSSRVSAFGKLAGAAATTHLATVLQQQRASGCRFVRLDLSEVSMLDHAGFDVLVDAHHRFLAAGGTLVLTGVGGRIARLLELTGLDRTLFTIARAGDPPPGQADRTVIDRAVGVVMGRARCGVADATAQLATLGRATNRTLGEVAQSILDEPARIRPHPHHVRLTRSSPD
jgi:anti-sigma B factor antagonist